MKLWRVSCDWSEWAIMDETSEGAIEKARKVAYSYDRYKPFKTEEIKSGIVHATEWLICDVLNE